MLSREVMGLLALAILWVNTLLVAGAAGRQIVDLLALRRRLRGALEGRVASGLGPAGALATHVVEQLGRQAADDRDRPAIAFTDRRYGGECHGGVVETSSGPVHVPAIDEAGVEIWPDPGALAAAAAGRGGFAAAYDQAKKAKGFARTVSTDVAAGARVWVVLDGPGAIVSAIDPRRWCTRKIALLVGFVLGALAIAGGCTAVALWPPHFGTISTVGGALCLAYFLLIQPAGTAVRDAVLRPSRAILRGSWIGPSASDGADAAIALAPPRR